MLMRDKLFETKLEARKLQAKGIVDSMLRYS